MALDSYDNLKTALKNWLDVGSTLDDYLDDFIDVCEARMRREVRMRDMLTRTTLAISADDREVSYPSDFLDIKGLRIRNPNTGDGKRYLRPEPVQVTYEQMNELSSNTADCQRYFVLGPDIEFERPADQAYTADILYYGDFDSLDGTNTSNEILAFAPDLYLWGSLSASAPHLQHDERLTTWENLYKQALDGLIRSIL